MNLLINKEGLYCIVRSPHSAATFSGGGAKTISYVGMLNALNEYDHLKYLSHVSGTSAGAVTASLLAVGMSSAAIHQLLSQLDMPKLLDRTILGRAKGDRFRNMLDAIYMMQFKHYLREVRKKPIPEELGKSYAALSLKSIAYEKMLAENKLSIDNVDDLIELLQSPDNKLVQLDTALATFSMASNRCMTFKNLKQLRELLGEESKHLIKNLTVAVTNQKYNTLDRYNEDTTPNKPIAQVVQWSAAHPGIFAPRKNALDEFVSDGGLSDNMPEIHGLHPEEVLCVRADTQSDYHARVQKAANEGSPEMLSSFKRALDYCIKFVFGGTWFNSSASVWNREKIFYHLDNMLFLNTGDITTTNTSPSEEQKKHAIQNGYTQTITLLQNQTKTFEHPLMALLYVGFDHLNPLILDQKNNAALSEAAIHAKKITFLQKQIVTEINEGDYVHIKNHAKQIEEILTEDVDMSSEQREKALALCYKQVNFMSEGKFLEHLNQEATAQKHWAIKILKLIILPIMWILSSIYSLKPVEPVKESPAPDNEYVESHHPIDIEMEVLNPSKHSRHSASSQNVAFFEKTTNSEKCQPDDETKIRRVSVTQTN